MMHLVEVNHLMFLSIQTNAVNNEHVISEALNHVMIAGLHVTHVNLWYHVNKSDRFLASL